ncbi:hypothetical protein AB0J43_01555 [Nonomuraea fuscirosea]
MIFHETGSDTTELWQPVPVHEPMSERDRLALLAETTTTLTSSLDVDETLRQLVRLVVPLLADWVVIDLFTEEGSVSRAVVVHYENGTLTHRAELEELLPPLMQESPMPLARALRGVAAALVGPEDYEGRPDSERALRLEVSGAASAFSRALLSYDYRDLQTTRSTLAAQATGDFLATYDTAFGGTMAQVIVKLKATSQATVREVYLADVDEATAHAIVVVDQQVNSSQAIRSVRDSHLKISLVKEKGSWKIHDVTALGAASEDQYSLDGDKDKKD